MVGSLGSDLLGQRVDQLLRAGAAAGEVVADVQHAGRTRLHREQRVEGRHAVDVGGGDGQPLRDVVERAGADPTPLLVQRVKGGEELGTLGPGGVTPVRGVPVLDAVSSRPGRHGRTEERVDGRALVGGRLGVEEAEIHSVLRYSPAVRLVTPAASLGPPFSFSTRTAVALNSAVPDFGSVASIVSTLTSTWSGKWKVMKASPGRRPVSRRTGASTHPRRELIFTISPGSTSRLAASAGWRSSVSPLRSGELYRFDWTPVL